MSKSAEIVSLLKQKIRDFDFQSKFIDKGHVLSVKDGVVLASGLRSVKLGEHVKFASGADGLVFDLHHDSVGIVLFGDTKLVAEGDEITLTGKVLSVPVGDNLLGRIIDPLGNSIDGKGPIMPESFAPIESPAHGIIERQSVCEAVHTGLKKVDSMFPIGRGQRQLIIGDRKLGKTSIAIDTIINQRYAFQHNIEKDKLFCIYVAIGQKQSSVARLAYELEQRGAMEYTIIISATAAESAALQYIAPYAGCTIGEYFMNSGRHALIVYDDLTQHAAAYRQISLLFRRPPGREAYPGDVFYLHSRLLERAAKLNDKHGGGSLTALPIIETQAGDVSMYIPTNVISITDGQLILESSLFYSGDRPAINTGLSVSRVGSAAQTKAIKKLGAKLKIELAQYRDVASFSQLASSLDAATRKTLKKGEVLMETLKQSQSSPLDLADQVLILYSGLNGYYDNMELGDIQKSIKNMLEYARVHYYSVLEEINTKKHFENHLEKETKVMLDKFFEL